MRTVPSWWRQHFRFSVRRTSLLGQNIEASLLLTLSMSFLLAAVAKVVAVGLGIPHTASLVDLALISILFALALWTVASRNRRKDRVEED